MELIACTQFFCTHICCIQILCSTLPFCTLTLCFNFLYVPCYCLPFVCSFMFGEHTSYAVVSLNVYPFCLQMKFSSVQFSSVQAVGIPTIVQIYLTHNVPEVHPTTRLLILSFYSYAFEITCPSFLHWHIPSRNYRADSKVLSKDKP